MRLFARTAVLSLVLCTELHAQADTTHNTAKFLSQQDLFAAGIAASGTVVLSFFDTKIAQASQRSRFQDSSLTRLTGRISKVNETTLTLAGIATYGITRALHAPTASRIALHATESVVLASVASQLIRGPLGRTRPYVTQDSDQYHFRPFKGFFGESSFDNRAFPSIHSSSSMAVATVLVMETHRRHPGATPIVGPLLFGAALLPGLSRIQLNQHWASDIAAGAFMGIYSGYKVVSYSYQHPDNRFDRMFLTATVMPSANGLVVAFSPSF